MRRSHGADLQDLTLWAQELGPLIRRSLERTKHEEPADQVWITIRKRISVAGRAPGATQGLRCLAHYLRSWYEQP